jgi:hypothetical protein
MVFRPTRPKKRYPDVYAAPYLSSIQYYTGIEAWMVRNELSGCVCCYFPGHLEDTLHPFLHGMGCVDPKIELARHCYPFNNLTVFPFDACSGLYNNPPANKNDTSKIHQLADTVLPPPAKGREQESIFRKVLQMGKCQNRVFCIYSAPGETVQDTCDKSQFYKDMVKIKEFFKMTSPPVCAPAYVLTQEQKSQFQDCLHYAKKAGRCDIS